jgi:N-formylglutamate amidohydrolase
MDRLFGFRHKTVKEQTRLTPTPETSFEILAPVQWTSPMVFNSPHSGPHLPQALLSRSSLSATQLRASEDSHVDQLFSGCVEAGAPLMRALVSRSYLDLNREPFELDARMFSERLPAYMNTSSPRVACGLGTIPRTVGDGVLIYNQPLTVAEALERVETCYRPYHRTLAALLDEAYAATGMALLVDCHSMPSSSVSAYKTRNETQTDIVLGDRFGSACDADLTAQVDRHFASAGLVVARNKPYSGGFFTESHGRPRYGRHALQIEINRALYMDETTRQPHSGFAALKQTLDQLSELLSQHLSHDRTAHAAAAE